VGPAPAVAAVRKAVRESVAALPPAGLVLVACSGGADSLALAAAVAHESRRAGWRGGAITVDHGLQAGSTERARAVATRCVALGLSPVEVVSVALGQVGGPEAAARAARYAALDAAAARHGAMAVLLGHTLDDQAETVLLGLARGSGARSLSGMAAEAGRYRRPLLALGRSTTRQACLALGLPVWEDPHNADPAYARVRIRHDVLPTMEKALGPGVADALARTAQLLRDDADALDAAAVQVEPSVLGPQGSLRTEGLAALPRALRTRLLRRAALRAGCPATDLTADQVADLDRLVTDWHGQRWVSLPGGRRARRRDGVIGVDSLPTGE